MNLTLDIGNTKIKWGLFSGRQLSSTGFLDSDKPIAKFFSINELKFIAFCASGKKPQGMFEGLALPERVIDLQTIDLPFKSDYKTPDTLGRDRVAAIMGGLSLFPGDDLLIIDAGSCITYDLIDASGTHKGGIISPGLSMRWKAMHHFTENLPLVEKSEPPNPLSLTTNTALEQGGLLGALFEIEGYICYLRGIYPKLKILITGGDAPIFVKFIKLKIFAEPNLVLKGLNEIIINYAEKNIRD